VSQRRAALLLKTTRKTVVRKFLFLAEQSRLNHQKFLLSLKENTQPISEIFFDEMESCEKSKLLPVSIPLVVQPKGRKILGFRVCSMPSKGLLAEASRKKYGPRIDQRGQAVDDLFKELSPYLDSSPKIVTDEKPTYPHWIKKHFPHAIHTTHKGRRGCVVGQGELKRGGFDPLFALNHTAAMLRANINRLFRKTWCISKLKERLEAHIYIYMDYHNHILT
jgi:hypothetical protein